MSALVLDWRHPRHYDAGMERPCRLCKMPTPLRDDRGRPAHKVCAEMEAVRTLHAYRRDPL